MDNDRASEWWLSVDREKPEDGAVVIVAIFRTTQIDFAYTVAGLWYRRDGRGLLSFIPTHWRQGIKAPC